MQIECCQFIYLKKHFSTSNRILLHINLYCKFWQPQLPAFYHKLQTFFVCLFYMQLMQTFNSTFPLEVCNTAYFRNDAIPSKFRAIIANTNINTYYLSMKYYQTSDLQPVLWFFPLTYFVITLDRNFEKVYRCLQIFYLYKICLSYLHDKQNQQEKTTNLCALISKVQKYNLKANQRMHLLTVQLRNCDTKIKYVLRGNLKLIYLSYHASIALTLILILVISILLD